MKDHHTYPTMLLGISDIAALTIRAYDSKDGLILKALTYGEDGGYRAYIVDAECEIPEHYELVAEADRWLEIFDDYRRVLRANGEHIAVYRAGAFGTIIQIQNGAASDE